MPNVAKRHRYTVGVRKEYFPVTLHPPTRDMTAYYEVVRGVLAENRQQAADKVWAGNGARWLSLMNPDTTLRGNRIISLEVNDPVRGISPGRLAAVKVYEGKGREESALCADPMEHRTCACPVRKGESLKGF